MLEPLRILNRSRTSILRLKIFLRKIILIRRWNVRIYLHFWISVVEVTWDINLLMPIDGWFKLSLSFNSRGIVALLVHLVHLVIFRLVEVLSCVILVLHLHFNGIVDRHFLLVFVTELHFFIEAATGWPVSGIRWRMPRPLHALNDFSSSTIDSTKWVHLAIFGQYGFWPRHFLAIGRCDILASLRMLQVLLVESRSDI